MERLTSRVTYYTDSQSACWQTGNTSLILQCLLHIICMLSVSDLCLFVVAPGQCGVLLGMLLLIGSSWLTYLSCSLLVKAAHTSRKRSYEFLGMFLQSHSSGLCVVSVVGGSFLKICSVLQSAFDLSKIVEHMCMHIHKHTVINMYLWRSGNFHIQ